jgi:hypothetical protein
VTTELYHPKQVVDHRRASMPPISKFVAHRNYHSKSSHFIQWNLLIFIRQGNVDQFLPLLVVRFSRMNIRSSFFISLMIHLFISISRRTRLNKFECLCLPGTIRSERDIITPCAQEFFGISVVFLTIKYVKKKIGILRDISRIP